MYKPLQAYLLLLGYRLYKSFRKLLLRIFVFLSNWNSFLFPFILTSSEQIRTLPVGLAFYLGKQSIDWGHLMAGASISATPVILLFVLFQKQITPFIALLFQL